MNSIRLECQLKGLLNVLDHVRRLFHDEGFRGVFAEAEIAQGSQSEASVLAPYFSAVLQNAYLRNGLFSAYCFLVAMRVLADCLSPFDS